MIRLLLAVFVVFALVACESAVVPPVVEEAPPVVEVPVDPPVVFAPVGSCPVLVVIVEGPPAALAPTIVSVRLGTPCVAGSVVPVAWRQQLLHLKDSPGGYVRVFDGVLSAGRGLQFAVPFVRRAERFEVVDLRTGVVVAAVQNGRLRQPW